MIGSGGGGLRLEVGFAPPIRVIMCLFDYALSNRVVKAVTNTFVQRFVASNAVVMISFLPYGNTFITLFINLPCGKCLEGMHDS